MRHARPVSAGRAQPQDAAVGCVGAGPTRVTQKSATWSLPPAFATSTENAGLSRALPGLSVAPAWKALHSPFSDGEGVVLGRAASDALGSADSVSPAGAAPCSADSLTATG